MKVKEKNSNSTDELPKQVKTNGTIEKKKKKKKKENFEVRIPRIIVRNLDFKVNQIFQHQYKKKRFILRLKKIN
jgi:hypothetical protein